MSKRARPRKKRKPLVPFMPVMGRVRDRIATDMHLAVARLLVEPSNESRDDLADAMNVIGLCIQGDRRFVDELRVLNEAAQVIMEPFGDAPYLSPESKDKLTHAVTVMDSILGLLNLHSLFNAERAYVAAMRTVQRSEVAR